MKNMFSFQNKNSLKSCETVLLRNGDPKSQYPLWDAGKRGLTENGMVNWLID
jgi:hypothetical protein